MFGVTGLQVNQIKSQFDGDLNRWKYRLNYISWMFSWIVGHLVGGMVLCGLLGFIGSIFSLSVLNFCLIFLGILCCLGTLHQFKIIHLPMPQFSRQVSRLWLTEYHQNFTAFGYGFQLGSGVATRIKTITTYVVIGFALCSGSLYNGALIGAFFGLSRAILPLILVGISATPGKSFVFSLKFNAYENLVRKINGLFLLLSGAILFFLLFF
jgi:hypothetical protein